MIDGRGKYLMPGLVDMHVHIQFEDDMLLWVANGVTSVRNMWGHTGKMLQFGFPDQLELREQIEQGTLFGWPDDLHRWPGYGRLPLISPHGGGV